MEGAGTDFDVIGLQQRTSPVCPKIAAVAGSLPWKVGIDRFQGFPNFKRADFTSGFAAGFCGSPAGARAECRRHRRHRAGMLNKIQSDCLYLAVIAPRPDSQALEW